MHPRQQVLLIASEGKSANRELQTKIEYSLQQAFGDQFHAFVFMERMNPQKVCEQFGQSSGAAFGECIKHASNFDLLMTVHLKTASSCGLFLELRLTTGLLENILVEGESNIYSHYMKTEDWESYAYRDEYARTVAKMAAERLNLQRDTTLSNSKDPITDFRRKIRTDWSCPDKDYESKDFEPKHEIGMLNSPRQLPPSPIPRTPISQTDPPAVDVTRPLTPPTPYYEPGPKAHPGASQALTPIVAADLFGVRMGVNGDLGIGLLGLAGFDFHPASWEAIKIGGEVRYSYAHSVQVVVSNSSLQSPDISSSEHSLLGGASIVHGSDSGERRLYLAGLAGPTTYTFSSPISVSLPNGAKSQVITFSGLSLGFATGVEFGEDRLRGRVGGQYLHVMASPAGPGSTNTFQLSIGFSYAWRHALRTY